MQTKGYQHSLNDHSLFLKHIGNSITIVAIYVDGIIVTGDNLEEISTLKSFLDDQFKIKDLGYINLFLGLEFNETNGGMVVNQDKFILDLLQAYSMTDCNPVSAPLPSNLKLFPKMDNPLKEATSYRQLIGKLNFLLHTRPDLSFTVQYLSQFNQTPCEAHYDAALHVLKYLKGTASQGIFLNDKPLYNIEAYCDSDWAACPITRRSVSGFFILFGGTPISWKSKKQITVSLSSTEAEYRSMRQICSELAWISRLLNELGVPNVTPIPLKCDNQAAIYIAKNPVFHERTKHIEVDCHFVREKLVDGLISLSHVPTNEQLADVFTKTLSGPPHVDAVSKLGVLPYPPA